MKLKLDYSSRILSNPKEPPYYQLQPTVLSLSLSLSSAIGSPNQCPQVSTFRPLALNTPTACSHSAMEPSFPSPTGLNKPLFTLCRRLLGWMAWSVYMSPIN